MSEQYGDKKTTPEQRLDNIIKRMKSGDMITLTILAAIVFQGQKDSGRLALMIKDRVQAGQLELLGKPRSLETYEPLDRVVIHDPNKTDFAVRLPEPVMA